ncbi:MAG: type II toxin-antitoxin system Phd/YefM family antitoxin [Patescibacteria group bacterium]
MTKTVSATQARKQWFKLLTEAGVHGAHIRITLGDKPPVIMMSEEELEGWLETLEIMSDPELVKGIREGERDIAAGRVISLDALKKKYKL